MHLAAKKFVDFRRLPAQVLADPSRVDAGIRSLSRGSSDQRAAAAVLSHALHAERRWSREAEAIASFSDSYPTVPVVVARDILADVHDVAGLKRVGRELFPEPSG